VTSINVKRDVTLAETNLVMEEKRKMDAECKQKALNLAFIEAVQEAVRESSAIVIWKEETRTMQLTILTC
jgi:hypothetical protein